MGKNDNNTDALAEMVKKLKALEEENAKLKAQKTGKLSLKVSEKGALSIYGMGRFPVTLYAQQWETLLADVTVATIKAFIVDHKAEFSTKENPKVVTGGAATAPKTGSAV